MVQAHGTNGYTNGVHSNGHSNGHSQHQVDPTAAVRPVEPIKVHSPLTSYDEKYINAKYVHHSAEVVVVGDGNHKTYEVKPIEKVWELRTDRKVPKTGSVFI
jgi:myo-inositol-1-phosphate synthase